jgi:multidrug resistance protein, MATE family
VLPSLYLFVISQCFANFSSAQRQQYMSRNATIIGAFVHIGFVYLFYNVLEMGFFGVCLATAIMFLTRFSLNFGQVYFDKTKFPIFDDIVLFSSQSYTGVEKQIWLGINSLSMSVWGWWAFDVITFIASYLGAIVIASQTIMRSIGLITFMLPVGIMSACSTLTGNSVGEGRADKVTTYYRTSMILCFILAMLQVIFLVGFEDLIVLAFTDNTLIQEQMRLAWVVLQVFVIFDTTQAVSSAVIRGSG